MRIRIQTTTPERIQCRVPPGGGCVLCGGDILPGETYMHTLGWKERDGWIKGETIRTHERCWPFVPVGEWFEGAAYED